MTIQYTWKLKSIKKTNVGSLENAIVQSYWLCTGTDEDGNTGEFNGATPFTPTDANNDGFIDYKDLTEDVVLGWVKDSVYKNGFDHVKRMIEKQINSKKVPIEEVKEEDLPWNQTPPDGENNG
jgi:hypothetical protein